MRAGRIKEQEGRKYIGFVKNGGQYDIETEIIDRESYLCRQFLLNHWSEMFHFDTIRFVF